MKPIRIVISCLFVTSCVTTQPTDYGLNSDFERVNAGLPEGWSYRLPDSNSYDVSIDPEEYRTGQYSLRLTSVTDSPGTWGTIVAYRLPVWFKMRQVQLRGYVKRENIETGIGGLWARIDRSSGYPSFQEQSDYDLPPTEDWTWYELPLEVGNLSREISFGGILTGTGTLWLDSLTLDIDGVPYLDAANASAGPTQRLVQNSLKGRTQSMSNSQGRAKLMDTVRDYPLVVVHLTTPGERNTLQFLSEFVNQAAFDYVLLSSSRFRPLQYAVDSPQKVLPYWPNSMEWAAFMRERIQDPDCQLMGIGLDDPEDLLDLVESRARGELPLSLWHKIDSLHRCLNEDLGYSLISRSTVTLLSSLSDSLPTPSDQQAAWAWNDLRHIEEYYARNGSQLYLDSLMITQIRERIRKQPGTRTMVILPSYSFATPGRDQITQLREQWGDDLLTLTFTVGHGYTLDSQAEPLAPLGPHCWEYYLDKVEDAPYWADLRRPTGWLPPNLFLRALPYNRTQQPFVTINPATHSDIWVYLGEGEPAYPYRSNARR